MTWEHGRQLASASDGTTSISYIYDDGGIRTSKTVGNVTTSYNVIDGNLRSMTAGTDTLEFVYGNGGVSSVLYSGNEYWYIRNAQSDVIGLIDSTGSYVVHYTYDAWGLPTGKTGTMADTLGTLNPFRYRGYIYDEETGLYYLQSRYYNPTWGRFINADGYVSTGQGILGNNMFAYCGNNPVIRADHSGEFWDWQS